eukprot:RCo045754
MRVRLLFISVVAVVLAVIPGVLFACLFQILAFAALDRAGSVMSSARGLTLSAERCVRVATDASRSSANSSERSLYATSDVLGWSQLLALGLHSRAMGRMETAVSRRLDAAEGVTEAMGKAWERGFLRSCNLNSTGLTFTSFMAQFREQVQPFPHCFKYIYYDEPNPVMSGEFTDCGWADSSNYTFYAMGDDQRYVYWGDEGAKSFLNSLWKDEAITFYSYTPQRLATLESDGFLWGSYIYVDVIDGLPMSPVLLYSRWLSTRSDGSITGIFGVDLDMDFLSSSLQSSLVTPESLAFIIDLGQNQNVIAHTFADVPLFTGGSASTPPAPFTAQEFPSPLMQASVEALVGLHGSLENVAANFSELSWNGTTFLCSTLVFYRRGLHWLSCQLTPKEEFEGQISSSSEKLLSVLGQGRATMDLLHPLEGTLGIVTHDAEAKVQQTSESTSGFRTAVTQFAIIAAGVLSFCLALGALVVFRIVQVVQQLSRDMAHATGMNWDGTQRSTSVFLELDHLQRAFRTMATSLRQYKHFLPSEVAKETGAAPESPRHGSPLNPLNPLKRFRLPISHVASAELTSIPSISVSGQDRRLSSSVFQTSFLQFGTVVCISQFRGDLYFRCLLPAMYSRRVADMVTL